MQYIYSQVRPGVLLHAFNHLEEITPIRRDISPRGEFLQVACFWMEQGQTFRPHAHVWKDPPSDDVIAQESWVVLRGKVRVFFYDLDDSLIATVDMVQGSCSITYQGGHTYECLEHGSAVLEFKTGPYRGQEKDKRFLNDPGV